ncbi:uncharacterized protein BDZ99DRAFT_442635, partial [Mytilinidion resinicola]
MDASERKIMSTWLYQFWLFSFTTAKFWGKGPRNWTAHHLGFTDQPFTSSESALTPRYPLEDRMDVGEGSSSSNGLPLGHLTRPTTLCNWAIHVFQEGYEGAWSETDPIHDKYAVDTGSGLKDWPPAWTAPPFEARLRNNIESNDFSSLPAETLPMAISQVAKAAEKSPNELLKEALGFAIMGRNIELIENLCEEIRAIDFNIFADLYPFHLATSYLDGSKTCCHVLETLKFSILETKKLTVDNFGHTILDNLMIQILKNHSSVTPELVDDALRGEIRFAGEETDICGRWDADTEHYRLLLKTNHRSVPFEWKHKFCHTSAQAIVHCIAGISSLSGLSRRSNDDTMSGLFLKHCSHCGKKLQLRPLHTLVLTAFFLGKHGCEDENFFGMIACLFTLVGIGADVLDTADISLSLILSSEYGNECSHKDITPLCLASLLTKEFLGLEGLEWTEEKREGWWVFCDILRRLDAASNEFMNGEYEQETEDGPVIYHNKRVRSTEEHAGQATMPYMPCDIESHGDAKRGFFSDHSLGHIWAAVQAELLTYRREKDEDEWISQDFDWKSFCCSLKAGERPSIPLLHEGMMKPYCACGIFGDGWSRRARRDEVCAFHFSNMEDWSRSTFLDDIQFEGFDLR